MPLREIRTVGDLREILRHSEDDESLTVYLVDGFCKKTTVIVDSANSAAGGRATILWLRKAK